MAITPPTTPTPPTPPKITIGDAARDAENSTTHTTADAQAEQQARDAVAQGNGALSKTTTGTADRAKAGQNEQPNASARADAADGDRVNTARTRVDHGTKTEGQTGADVANGLDTAQENAALRKQLGIGEDGQGTQTPAQPPQSYTAASSLYWAGMIALALVLGAVFLQRFFRRKNAAQNTAEEHLSQRPRARERGGGTPHDARSPVTRPAEGDHGDLLQAAARTRRSRGMREEILPEYTGLTAGEALARLSEQEKPATAPASPRQKTPRTSSGAAAPPRPAPPSAPQQAARTEVPDGDEAQPRF